MERINSGGHAWHKRTDAFGNDLHTVEPLNTVTDRPKKKLAALTDDRTNEGFFFTRKRMAVLPGGQKNETVITRWRITEVAVRRGFTVI